MPTQQERAAEIIVAMLVDGPRPSTEIVGLATMDEGISQPTLYRAKKDLGVLTTHERTDDGRRFSVWSLPDYDNGE
jgi:hypothetical protein